MILKENCFNFAQPLEPSEHSILQYYSLYFTMLITIFLICRTLCWVLPVTPTWNCSGCYVLWVAKVSGVHCCCPRRESGYLSSLCARALDIMSWLCDVCVPRRFLSSLWSAANIYVDLKASLLWFTKPGSERNASFVTQRRWRDIMFNYFHCGFILYSVARLFQSSHE